MRVYTIKKQRNEYGRQIRKLYDAGIIKEKMGNMREIVLDKTGIVHTVTTVVKDYGYLLEINDV